MLGSMKSKKEYFKVRYGEMADFSYLTILHRKQQLRRFIYESIYQNSRMIILKLEDEENEIS